MADPDDIDDMDFALPSESGSESGAESETGSSSDDGIGGNPKIAAAPVSSSMAVTVPAGQWTPLFVGLPPHAMRKMRARFAEISQLDAGTLTRIARAGSGPNLERAQQRWKILWPAYFTAASRAGGRRCGALPAPAEPYTVRHVEEAVRALQLPCFIELKLYPRASGKGDDATAPGRVRVQLEGNEERSGIANKRALIKRVARELPAAAARCKARAVPAFPPEMQRANEDLRRQMSKAQ